MRPSGRPSAYSSPPHGGYAATPARAPAGSPSGADRGLPTPVPVATPAFVPPLPPMQLRSDEDVERHYAEGWALLNHRKTEKQARALAVSLAFGPCSATRTDYVLRFHGLGRVHMC